MTVQEKMEMAENFSKSALVDKIEKLQNRIDSLYKQMETDCTHCIHGKRKNLKAENDKLKEKIKFYESECTRLSRECGRLDLDNAIQKDKIEELENELSNDTKDMTDSVMEQWKESAE